MNATPSLIQRGLLALAVGLCLAAVLPWLGAVVAHADGSALPAPMPTESPPEGKEGDGRLLLPDLVTMEPTNLRLVRDRAAGRVILRFSNTIANVGEGPIDLRGRATDESHRYRVSQLMRHTTFQYQVQPVDDYIMFHTHHNHWHLDGFARYELWSMTSDGYLKEVLSLQGKVSYCLLDGHRMEGSSTPASYTTCNPRRQGISVGWSDTYTWDLSGQRVELSGLEDGYYVLRSVVNPRGVLRETRLDNNDVLLAFELDGFRTAEAELAADPWAKLSPQVIARWKSLPGVPIRALRKDVLSPALPESRP